MNYPEDDADILALIFEKDPFAENTEPIDADALLARIIQREKDREGKYTCSFCEREFTESEVKEWWRKPDNAARKPPIPLCPDPVCKNAGALPYWNVDWSKRRKAAAEWPTIRAERQKKYLELTALARKLREEQKIKDMEDCDDGEYLTDGIEETSEDGNEVQGETEESGECAQRDIFGD